MLRRLRKQMVLLNAVISGTILLAMAFVALHVSEGVLASQYERDLERNASIMVSTMLTAPEGVRVQFASDYFVYHAKGETVQVINGEQIEPAAMAAMARQVTEMIGTEQENVSVTVALQEAEGDEKIGYQKFFVATGTFDQGNVAVSGMALPDSLAISRTFFTEDEGMEQSPDAVYYSKHVTTLSNDFKVLVNAGGTSYRIEVPVWITQGSEPQMVMVVQDRTAELQSRTGLRWLFFGCALGGLLLIGAASLYLSARSIRPVEQSIRRQHEFVAAASHELRTPVAALRANAEVLADAELGEYAPYLSAIEQESRRMTHLVTDLMDLARADAEGLQIREELVEVEEVAQRTVDAMRPFAEQKGIRLSAELQPALVKADADRLRQALVALLDNALRYTGRDGVVRVELNRTGSHALLRVIDNGRGIPDEHKTRVFDRFYRVAAERPADGGCGLGLSVARQLVEKMGGTLKLTDAPGGGCVFEIRFRLVSRH